ncbi:MAG: tetratricopeptide repeat protein [Oscillospiraceae bacterium]|nr:tetratricopeptide repeat protein [Ruminococcus sp.]MDY3087676.1 tetratricopeptide repeat protein [Oscillospiraceae bacterium]
MAEDKEKSLTDETLPKEPEETSASWDWDAAVPQTDTSNITLDDLQETEEKVVEQPAEEPEENETEKEEEAPASNPDDDGLCIVCGKERGNSPSDLYCNACRAKFLRTNYGVGHIILAFFMVIVAALGYFVATSTVTVSSKLYKAEQCISEKRYNDALNLCSEAFDATDKLNSGVNAVIKGINSNATNQDWFTEGEKATHLILETYVHNMTINASDRQTFVEAVEKYYADGELDQPRNANIKKLYNAIKSVDAIATSLDEKMNSFVTQKEDGTYDVKYDEGIKFFDSYKVDTDIEKGLMEYYKFMLAYYANKDSKTALGFIDNAYKISGEYGYLYLQNYMGMAWQYKEYDKVLELSKIATELNVNDASAYYYAVKVYIEKNDFDTADKMCEEMRKANPDGIDYYSTKAEVLRRQNKLDEAIEICRKGIVAGSDSEIYRQQAIAYLLKSDKENALEAIKQSYEIASQNQQLSIQTANTVALICFICDDTATYEEVEAMFKQSNMELSDSVKKCIKGDITFEDIFMKGSGEIS